MKKFFGTILLLNILAIVGILGFLFFTGRIDKEKTLVILDLLKHQGTPEKLREHTYEILTATTSTAPASQPTSQPAVASTNPGSAAERLAAASQMLDAERLKLDNEARELRHRQDSLQELEARINAKIAKFEQEKKEYDTRIASAAGKTNDDAFNRSLEVYDQLKPKQIKEIFYSDLSKGKESVELIAKYLLAMDREKAGKIIAEFKTPEERAFITSVLEKIRTATPAGVPAASPTSAVPPGAVQPRS